MADAPRDRRRSRAPAVAADDDGEEHHLKSFLAAAPSPSSRVQFRKVAARVRWVEEVGAAEVVDIKGKLWMTASATWSGKLYCNACRDRVRPQGMNWKQIENKFKGIPLKFCHADIDGPVLSFDKVTLPSLP